MQRATVTIGAGHGGHDCGTVGQDGLVEKDVTLLIARLVIRRLSHFSQMEARALREDDRYISTRERAKQARNMGSSCHVEIHADLGASGHKSTAVLYAADIPSDRVPAAKLARRLSEACGVTDCGARVRFDYCALFQKLDGFEDYYELVEALGGFGPRHVFYCECGFPANEKAVRRLAIRVAEAVARTVCELYGIFLLPPALRPQEAAPTPEQGAQIVFLKAGYFNIRAGPGARFVVVRKITGLIYTRVYGASGGWLRIRENREEFLSETAVGLYVGPPPPGGLDVSIRETVGRDCFYLVLTEPRSGAEALGAVGVGAAFVTTPCGTWRRIRYCDREGFLGPSAFERLP